MIDVFLSYRKETGSELAGILKESLEEDGYSVFFDEDSLRQGDFENKIDNAIKESSFVLVLLTPRDLDRCFDFPDDDWIVHEVGMGMENGKIVIPVQIMGTFVFPDKCKEIPALEFLTRQNLCKVSGPNFANLIKTELYDFMQDSPVKRIRDEYNSGIKQKEYLDWEIDTLRGIYSDIDFVSVFDRAFPVATYEGSEVVKYPFEQLNKRDNLYEIEDPIDYKDSPFYDEFKKVVGPNIHFPDLYGFTNVGIIFDDDDKVVGFKAKPRTYKETVYSGHILHYELWKAYQKTEGRRLATLDDLPMRKKIHGERTSQEVLTSGCDRSSLCDVVIAVLAYDEIENDYDIALATRSLNVACYPGYLSIVPSGGFELYELEDKQNSIVIKQNFKVIAALYREYIEELFGDTEFDQATGNDDMKRLYRNQHVKDLKEGINKGKFLLEFLGVVIDLLSLRPTLSFVLRIDDPEFLFSNEIKKNDENVDIRFVSLCNLEDVVKESFEKNQSPLMAESAGVYSLLKKNHLYIDAISKKV